VVYDPSPMEPKLDALYAWMRDARSVLVCFSGGVDSAFVLKAAHVALGDRALGLTALSPALPIAEREAASAVAAEIGVPHAVVDSHEIDDPSYVKNAVNRCFFCKSELYRIALAEGERRGFAVVVNGTNLDDLGDHRPGLQAATDQGVRSPLVELGFTKDDIRRCARAIGLSVWDKPAAACLASRIPYGTSVTNERLRQIDRAEDGLRALGFRQVRVRYHGDVARVEVGAAELAAAFERRAEVSAACHRAGFTFATLDLDGYRLGSNNEAVRLKVLNS
jgi:uncharacterized protein